MIVQVFSKSMIFPCMELFLVIFQVFHDFQSLWEPCWCYGTEEENSLTLKNSVQYCSSKFDKELILCKTFFIEMKAIKELFTPVYLRTPLCYPGHPDKTSHALPYYGHIYSE